MILRLSGLLIVAALLAGGWVWTEWQGALRQVVRVDEQGLDFQIEPGESFATVVTHLTQQGVIQKPRYLIWQARVDGLAQRIQAGRYHIATGISAFELVDLFVRGRVKESSLTLIEGWNFRQMMAAVRAHPALVRELDGMDGEQIMERLGYPGQHPEGRFLPETYEFPEGTTDTAFLQRAYQSMLDVLEQEWADRQEGLLPYSSAEDALIMASIIEKETALAAERAEVAGVFIRRLHKNMRLQTDPTVIYGMGDRFDGNIRRRDLRTDTPYNTYMRKGLPPTPIAMPGRAAIRAALQPAEGDTLYFVARGDGSHQFSATLKQHQAAVRKYQLKK